MSPKCLPPTFSLIRLTVREQMLFQDFQAGHHGGHLRNWNETNSNSKSPCHPNASHHVWAQSDLRSGVDVVCRFSRCPPRRPSWIAKRNDFSKSESLCHSDASHQVLAQSDLRFGTRCRLRNFKMAAMAAILEIGTEPFHRVQP